MLISVVPIDHILVSFFKELPLLFSGVTQRFCILWLSLRLTVFELISEPIVNLADVFAKLVYCHLDLGIL